ncbi:glycine dehydrogenase (aminomethyl-transferring) [Corynebacterium xerosis]|uniref:glycine dehydrogenase (aminomethyl-transferring) n=1 Tax=Corynebacterium xerosis TaxID=1725 RepID=A0A2N6SYX1_9CORY|nr:aminomethyl-transferring glycine dehydrogenase [Corynebacterium xerosis]PMC62262.1 glycine dehydrogenase (aminomethyl-transferring) [Corynebacterium xerosis]
MATPHDAFVHRHIGPDPAGTAEILDFLGYDSPAALATAALPADIAQTEPTQLPDPLDEAGALAALRGFAAKNTVKKQLIGAGYHDTITPAVIRRNVVENPGWYTAYTPYQPEISQGRLEALLNFQTAVSDLTGLPVAGASLLDEATAVAEAIQMMARGNANAAKKGGVVLLDAALHRQNLTVTIARAEAAGIDARVVEIGDDVEQALAAEGEALPLIGVVLANPGTTGEVRDLTAPIASAKAAGGLVTVACDLLAQVLIASPGSLGADIAVGSAQRFGVPLFYGGPHAAFMSCTEALQRKLPGRLVGVSVDADGAPAYRLALQTREQHIRRDRATSNICTAQALLAVIAGFYAVWHGPAGLREIASAVHARACALSDLLRDTGFEPIHATFFDTLAVDVSGRADSVRPGADVVLAAAVEAGFNLRRISDDVVGVSIGESTTGADVAALVAAISDRPDVDDASGDEVAGTVAKQSLDAGPLADLLRTDDVLTHPIFNTIRSETQMMRYLRRLSDRDLALDRTMIPLGSCTMKLNAAVSMEPITWPEFAGIHPMAPEDQATGWLELIADLEDRLARITGYAKVSVQPNAGSQGEFAGLLAIRRFHVANGDGERDIVLIPASAHGTNAASAALAGLKVVAVANADDGSIDLADLDAKLAKHGDAVAAIMITYPSTHGVFEGHVREVCAKVHEAGGQVYIDGANLNALVGLAQPGEFGGDVSHLNLHKTFTIPHGGGGPGVGPVCVAEHLVPFLPSDPLSGELLSDDGLDAVSGRPVSAARYGSAGVLPISWTYIAMMGAEGLAEASRMALVGANYISKSLEDAFPTVYVGDNGLVAHECILDVRDLAKKSGITAEDVSKRLMDFGFHAPTLAFPVPGTLMVEPTESEDKGELDRFIEAMRTIRAEIDEVIAGDVTAEESVLRAAPFTAAALLRGDFDEAVGGGKFSREKAAFPVDSLRADKYFPPVRRIDNAYGDRNLMCSCPPIEAFDIDGGAGGAGAGADAAAADKKESHDE